MFAETGLWFISRSVHFEVVCSVAGIEGLDQDSPLEIFINAGKHVFKSFRVLTTTTTTRSALAHFWVIKT